MSSHQDKFIDLEKIISSKNPRLLKFMPRFLLNYIRRTIHEGEINAFIDAHGHLRNLDFTAAVMEEFGVKVRYEGLEHIPTEGGCIVAANHPLGGLDALALMQAISTRRTDQRFFVNDILLNLKNFGDIFVGVNKHGKNPKENLRLMDDVFAAQNCVLFFPAGLVSRRQNDIVKDLTWQKSFVTKSVQYKKPIIPTYIGGQNSNFFYNLANWRKKCGIKANIEMFYLVDEMYRQKGKTLDVFFGAPVTPSVFTREKNHAEWAEGLKNYVYCLPKGEKRPFSVDFLDK